MVDSVAAGDPQDSTRIHNRETPDYPQLIEKNWSGREDLNLRPPGPDTNRRSTSCFYHQIEWPDYASHASDSGYTSRWKSGYDRLEDILIRLLTNSPDRKAVPLWQSVLDACVTGECRLRVGGRIRQASPARLQIARQRLWQSAPSAPIVRFQFARGAGVFDRTRSRKW